MNSSQILSARGRQSQHRGIVAEAAACAALDADGWTIHARRMRTAAGEVDVVAERDGMLAFVEVKSRPTLAMAAASLGKAQRVRLMGAAEIILGDYPGWGQAGARFDVMLVDQAGQVRRVADAFRLE